MNTLIGTHERLTAKNTTLGLARFQKASLNVPMSVDKQNLEESTNGTLRVFAGLRHCVAGAV